ncbi:MAG TPA: protein translocase subunit SecD [Gemmatimonadales bacterium]
MKTIGSRMALIGGLTALCVFLLVPRDVTIRVRGASGLKDTTVRQVPIKMGLDLRGGMHLALEVDESKGPVADCRDAIRRAERVVRTRIDEFGTTEPDVRVVGDCRLVVELPGIEDAARAKSIVQQTAFLEFRITDNRNLFAGAVPAVDRALREAGVKGPAAAPGVAQLLGGDTSNAPGPLSALLYQGEQPGEFRVPEEEVARMDSLMTLPAFHRAAPRGIQLRWEAQPHSAGGRMYRRLYALEDRAIITGECLQRAQATRDPVTSQSQVQFTLTRRCARRFADVTARNIGNYLAIILDNRVQGQPPVIRDRIGAQGQIEMPNKPLQEANDLALVLRAGALPVPLQVVEERTIGPSLGQDSIRDGVRAAIMAVAFTVLVMMAYYRFAGLLAVLALLLYGLFTLGGLAAFGFTLTLPGLAGFALSIGMAVDANVLIFERIREELIAGKSVRLAVDEGFRNAMSAIIDSNVTTLLTAFILYTFGTGPVQGFAVTLIIGIFASMVTAVFVTKTFFLVWLRRRPAMTTVSI